jgi:hypothetical protein
VAVPAHAAMFVINMLFAIDDTASAAGEDAVGQDLDLPAEILLLGRARPLLRGLAGALLAVRATNQQTGTRPLLAQAVVPNFRLNHLPRASLPSPAFLSCRSASAGCALSDTAGKIGPLTGWPGLSSLP